MNQQAKSQEPRAYSLFSLTFFVFLLLCAMGYRLCAFAAEDFENANGLYKQGKFTEASKIYEELASKAQPSAQAVLFFNAANSQYRAGDIHHAVWNYERALARNPWFSDARYNLKAAKQKIEYKIEDHRNLFMRLHELVLQWVKTSHLVYAALFFSLLFFFTTAAWLHNPGRQAFWAFPRAECLAIFLLISLLWSAQVAYHFYYQEAIVLSNEVEVRYGPSMDNQSLMKLGGGLKVYIVDSREDWSRVVTLNGETGWIKNLELGRIDS